MRDPVTIRLYDISGQLIRDLVNQYHEAGQYKAFWDGRDSAGAEASSGVYLLRLASGGYGETEKITFACIPSPSHIEPQHMNKIR